MQKRAEFPGTACAKSQIITYYMFIASFQNSVYTPDKISMLPQ